MSADGTTEIATRPTVAIARADDEWSVGQMVEQARKIQECMRAVMVKDEHYGVIPGTGGRDGKPPKPTLLKPGAEKLCLMFRLCPEYETLRSESSPAIIAYTIRCTLIHIPSGNRIATGLGSCNSREKKYTRPADKKCPACGKETIIKGKDEYGGGWLCWPKKGGCNAKFKDGDAAIEKQDTGIADPSDLDNTILKMACKRALVAAVLNGTAASDCFTQDLEDLTDKAADYAPKPDNRAKSVPVTPADVMASKEQAAAIRALRTEVGGLSGNHERDRYPQMLHAYRNASNEPAQTEEELTETQANHLIRRLEEMKAKQHQNAREALGNIGQELELDDSPPEEHPHDPADHEQREALYQAIKAKKLTWSYVSSVFAPVNFGLRLNTDGGQSKGTALTALMGFSREQAETALAMIQAANTPLYDKVVAAFRASGKILTPTEAA